MFLEYALIFSVGFLLIRSVETLFGVPGSKRADQTALVRGRLYPEIANLLDDSGTRVVRILNQGQVMLAQTRLIIPRTSIFIDYREDRISDDLENFIIAHEIAHVRGRHVLLRMLFECVFCAALGSLAVVLTIGNPSVWNAALIAIPLIVGGISLGLLPLMWLIVSAQEYNADAFAARYIGIESALKQLETIKMMLPTSDTVFHKHMLDRARKLRERLIASSKQGSQAEVE